MDFILKEIKSLLKFSFFGVKASLLINNIEYHPVASLDLEFEYLDYTIEDDTYVTSLINNLSGDEVYLKDMLEWGDKIKDTSLISIDVQILYIKDNKRKDANIYNENSFISNWFNNALIRKMYYSRGEIELNIIFNLSNENYQLLIYDQFIYIDNEAYYLASGLPYAISSLI